MKKAILIIFISLFLFSCNTQRKALDSWLGSTKYNLILSWGPPARTAEDGNGGEVLIYARHIYSQQMGWNLWEYKMMYTNADGKIYHWRLTREPVPPTEVTVTFTN